MNSITTLAEALKRLVAREQVSLHTPGHKGRRQRDSTMLLRNPFSLDVTELPGLDDLSNPTGVLAGLEKRAACLWGADTSLLSVNGASAALMASLLCLGRRGKRVLLPRNSHRAAVSGMVLADLEPIWYEPEWDENWGFWGPATAQNIRDALTQETMLDLAGVVIVSPTYGGAISKVGEISSLCHEHNLPLLVDEAHGAHFLSTSTRQFSALDNGADLVIHSLHKTMTGLTQTGLLHLSKGAVECFGFSPQDLRMALNCVQSTSPSYLLLNSIDELVTSLEQDLEQICQIEELSARLRSKLKDVPRVRLYEANTDLTSSHIVVTVDGIEIETVFEFLMGRGIFAETILGRGILLMLGMGTWPSDGQDVAAAFRAFVETSQRKGMFVPDHQTKIWTRPAPIEQVLSPRKTFMTPSQIVPLAESIGKIAADIVAPCPPGWPILVPGQRISEDIFQQAGDMQSVRIIVDTGESL